MIIKNTSKYPTKEVRDLVRFALKGIPQNRRLEVHVKNTKKYAYAGTFYYSIPYCSSVSLDRSFLIVARIGSQNRFPKEYDSPLKRCQKYTMTVRNWKEALIHIIAHEGEHLRQHVKPKSMREDHAERRAYKTLTKYRKIKGVKNA